MAPNEPPLLGSKDQRPANSMLARFVPGRRFAVTRPTVGRLLDGTRSAANPSKLSEVTCPSAASCDKASSVGEGNTGFSVGLTSPLKKRGPALCSSSNGAWLLSESSILESGGVNPSQWVKLSRRKRAIR